MPSRREFLALFSACLFVLSFWLAGPGPLRAQGYPEGTGGSTVGGWQGGHPSRDPVYYVDPAAGSDSNTGLTQTQAWRHIPGSYRNDNSGFLAAPGWRVINAGDTIRIKSGTTITNRLVITSAWYGNGTASLPVTIMRDATWGTGPVTFDGASQTLATYDPMVFVWKRDYVHIDGVTPGGIVIRNSKARGFQATGTSEALKMKGLVVKNMKLFNNVEFNVNVQRNDSFLFQNIEIDGNHQNGNLSGGFMIGDNTYGCSNGQIINSQSYNNGDVPGTSPGYTNTWIGFWVTNSTNITFTGCSAHDNKGNGYDAGVVSNPPSTITDNIKYVNCEAYNNSNGFSCNLDDITGTARFWYVNCISRVNGAGWIIYQGPSAYVYNCLATGNTWGIYIDAPAFTNRSTVVDIENTIFYHNDRPNPNTTYPWDLWTHHTQSLLLTSDYNDFEQGTQSTCISWDGADIFDPYYYNSTSAPGSTTRTWYQNHGQDGHSLCSVDNEFADFVDPGANDYHISAESSLIGRAIVINNPAIPEIYRDRDGNPRPAAGPWDIGPYQYVAQGCTYALSPTGATFPVQGGTSTVNVTTSTGCGWTAASNSDWITIASGGSGSGSGIVSYGVASNTGSARSGSMTIAGQGFPVSQAGQSPKVSVRPTSINFGYVRVGRTAAGRVTVSNTGSGPLTVSSVSIGGANPGDFRQTNNCSSLAPGRYCTISVTFAPQQKGTRRATMSVQSNDPASPTVNVSLAGYGR